MGVEAMTVRFPAKDVLSSIWCSDGSGARCSLDLCCSSEDYFIADVDLDGDDVVFRLERVTPASRAPGAGGGDE